MRAVVGLSEPLVLINFKTYLEATGKRSVDLARVVERVGLDFGVKVAVAPQFCDIWQVVAQVGIPVFSQHIDSIMPGAFTGHVLAESVQAAGGTGTLLNHSERALRVSDIGAAIERSRELGLTTIVCAGDVGSASAASLLRPEMVAIEPPELIGSGRAVAKARPEVITESVQQIRRVNSTVKILCGAGVSTGDDVLAALKLGAQGVLVASAVVKSADPAAVVRDLCDAVRRFVDTSR